MTIHVEIKGLDKLKEKLDSTELLGQPMRKFLQRAMRTIQANIVPFTPTDTGRLRGGIVSDESVSIDPSTVPTWAQLAPMVDYAAFVEYGTKPHFPPISAVEPWAERHGISAFLTARAIARRGTKAWQMFHRGVDASLGAVQGYLNDLGEEIKGIWQR